MCLVYWCKEKGVMAWDTGKKWQHSGEVRRSVLCVCLRARIGRWMCFLICISSLHLLVYHVKCKSFVYASSDWLPHLFQMTGLKNTRCSSWHCWLLTWAILPPPVSERMGVCIQRNRRLIFTSYLKPYEIIAINKIRLASSDLLSIMLQ